MARQALPSIVSDLLDDPIVAALMAADGLEKASVIAVLEFAAWRLSAKRGHLVRVPTSRRALVVTSAIASGSPPA